MKIDIISIFKSFMIFIMSLQETSTFCQSAPSNKNYHLNLNGYWRNELDNKSLIHVDNSIVYLHNGDAKLAMDFKPDLVTDNTYHFSNLRFERFAMPASLPNISLKLATQYISLLKRHGATILVKEDTELKQSVVITWTVKDNTGSFILNRVL